MNSGLPNPLACQAAREGMLDYIEFIGPTSRGKGSPTVFHCANCRAWFERARSHASAMALISRRVVDSTPLDGLVVAELNAGRRQERAAAALASLKRLEVPPELAALVQARMAGAMRSAPDELGRRVALELASGSGPRIERQVSAMARLAAPAELDARVARSLAEYSHAESLPLRRWIAIAASLFVVFGAATLLRQSGLFQTRHYSFRVVHTESTASLDSVSRAQLSGLLGGLLDVPGEAR